jgi:hypothetical protein
MARHVAHEQTENVAVRKDYAEVTANGTRGTVVGLDDDVVPNQAARRE